MTTMLVTRAEPDAQATLERLAALDIPAVAAPLMVRQAVPAHLPPPEGFAALVVTSANALRALVDLDLLERVLHLPVFAVGDRTAHEARMLGFATVTSASGALEDLVATLAVARLDGPVLYPAGRHLSADLAHALAPLGLMVATVPVYEMVGVDALPDDALAGLADGRIGAVLHYSRRSAELFCAAADALEPGQRRSIAQLCLSEAVAAPLLEHKFGRILLADYPSDEAMMALALAFAREQTAP